MLIEEERGRIPHTNTQLARGLIGLVVGGTAAIIFAAAAHLMHAPMAVTAVLVAFAALALVVAIALPTWYWIVQPYTGE